MNPTIRAFDARDQDAVVGLSLRAWEPVFASLQQALGESGVFAVLYHDWRAQQADAVRQACEGIGMRVRVAEIDSAVVGFVAAHLLRGDGMGEVHMIAVDPDHQRSGVASLLLSTTMRWFRDEGMALAMIETGGDPGHAPARRTYERAGFTSLPVARYFQRL